MELVTDLQFENESNSVINQRNSDLVNDGADSIFMKESPNEDKVLDKDKFVEVYRTRFWILGLFAIIAFMQTVIWGTFGPIMESSEYAFEWEDSIIAVLQSLGPITVIVFIVPATWFSQTYGLRKGILGAIGCMTVATGIRCITSQDNVFTAMAIFGAIANGIGGCITLSIPAMISATWFPTSERTTATAVGSFSAQLGGAGMYLAPLIVHSPNSSSSGDLYKTRDDLKGDIMTLMYVEFGITLAIFLCVAIYFPDKPELPPSNSSGTERENYYHSVRKLSRNRGFLLVMGTYTFSYGIPVVWVSIINFSLQCIGINQDESMGVAITACLASALLSMSIAMATDRLYGYLKISIIALLILSSSCFLWFMLLINKFITPSLGQVYAAVSGGIAFEYASMPLLIELGVELGYPASEGVVGAALTAVFNIISALFLILYTIPSDCYYWATYILVCSTSLTIIPLLFVEEKHLRSSIDGK